MELPHIGKNCQLEQCHSLDFLPVACPLCQQTYCGEHRLPLDHSCSQWSRVDKQLVQCDTCQHLVKAPDAEKLTPEVSLEKHKASNCKVYLYPPNGPIPKINRQCTVKGCKDIDPRVGPIRCDGCEEDFCLRHRHPSAHRCKSLNDDEDRKRDRKLAAQEKVAKTFTSPTKKPKIKSVAVKSKNGGMVELMKIKSQAKGSASVPTSSRIYLYVQCPKESKLDFQSVYFDKLNSVGKALDLIADTCKVNNKNHTLSPTDPERLELFKCPEMTVLDKSCSLEKCLQNLDTVLLERQGSVSIEEDNDQ
ncbi:uncharacterized protein EV154DRAFT_491300 [Mucor mucedo]|uniref:uncharacterized protein n=1 Tax=Mucor mucedo TaxID=29922 RepID=UPI00221E75E2|nr:uncharacterized protein EV154DRAFT_491300 [Mucor mucedo]KAI7896946.1 hypothetical protein EV154DRAFT_491300 [Mucor mucedo]